MVPPANGYVPHGGIMREVLLERKVWAAAFFAAALGVAACGDAETTDTRGYTKAPLENPSVMIRAEPKTEMSRLGEPIKPPIVDPDALGAAEGASAGS